MNKNYNVIMSWLEVYEGGYVNHPRDPGRATYRGVTQAVYDGYRRRHGLSTRSVRHLSDAEHDAIYGSQYWQPTKCQHLPSGLDATVFDFAVNSGVSRSSKYLQRGLRALGHSLAADGHVGEVTLAAVADAERDGKIDDLIIDINRRRYNFVRSLSTFDVFGRGWTRRIMGDHMGVQNGDIGVIDRSIMLHRGDLPSTIAKPTQAAGGHADERDRTIGGAIGAIWAEFWEVFGLLRQERGAS